LEVGSFVAFEGVALKSDGSLVVHFFEGGEEAFLGEGAFVEGLDEGTPVLAVEIGATGADGEEVRAGFFEDVFEV